MPFQISTFSSLVRLTPLRLEARPLHRPVSAFLLYQQRIMTIVDGHAWQLSSANGSFWLRTVHRRIPYLVEEQNATKQRYKYPYKSYEK